MFAFDCQLFVAFCVSFKRNCNAEFLFRNFFRDRNKAFLMLTVFDLSLESGAVQRVRAFEIDD